MRNVYKMKILLAESFGKEAPPPKAVGLAGSVPNGVHKDMPEL
jgi:hypothetical protein